MPLGRLGPRSLVQLVVVTVAANVMTACGSGMAQTSTLGSPPLESVALPLTSTTTVRVETASTTTTPVAPSPSSTMPPMTTAVATTTTLPDGPPAPSAETLNGLPLRVTVTSGQIIANEDNHTELTYTVPVSAIIWVVMDNALADQIGASTDFEIPLERRQLRS